MTPLLEFRAVRLSRGQRGSAAWEPGAGITTDAIVSFEVRPHETLAIIGDGQSGAGLLAGLALGLDRPAGWSVLTLGTEIATLPRWEQLAFRRKVGYLPEGDGLLQNLSLRDNVRLPLRFGSDFRPREIEGRVDVIMAQLRIARVAALRPAEASDEDAGGRRWRARWPSTRSWSSSRRPSRGSPIAPPRNSPRRPGEVKPNTGGAGRSSLQSRFDYVPFSTRQISGIFVLG